MYKLYMFEPVVWIARINIMGDLLDPDPGIKNRQKYDEKVLKTWIKKYQFVLNFYIYFFQIEL